MDEFVCEKCDSTTNVGQAMYESVFIGFLCSKCSRKYMTTKEYIDGRANAFRDSVDRFQNFIDKK